MGQIWNDILFIFLSINKLLSFLLLCILYLCQEISVTKWGKSITNRQADPFRRKRIWEVNLLSRHLYTFLKNAQCCCWVMTSFLLKSLIVEWVTVFESLMHNMDIWISLFLILINFRILQSPRLVFEFPDWYWVAIVSQDETDTEKS